MSREKNLYRRSGVWWLRATVNGVEQRESLRTRDVRTARALRDKRLAEIKAARWFGVKRITWRDAVTAWADHEAGQIAQSTATRYAVSLL
jgi:integrase/recombinase XerD